MTEVFRSLADITTGYSIFEKDQVLTDQQLNSLANYFDDQTRLTRIELVGVGIVCGLRPLLSGTGVQVTKGVGVTTDGDLLAQPADTVYDQFKPYDASAPHYGPFYTGEQMIPAYELLQHDVQDERAAPLSQFGAQTGKTLANMFAVLLMESYQQDPDLCSGTDCDNLGQNSRNTLRLLLVDEVSAAALVEHAPTPRSVGAQLQLVVADRASIPNATNNAMLAGGYRTACNNMHTNIRAALTNLHTVGSALFSDVFPGAASGWTAPLDGAYTTYTANDLGIQYYYDFLKDLIETYNDLRWFLFEDATVCCPDIQWFPKHLVLGPVTPGTDPNQHRTGLYPSPLVSATVERWWYAKWLAGKMNVMINTFQVPAAGALPIRITPSRFEDSRLETRAIPYYYQVGGPSQIHQAWNFGFARRGMGAFNYSYNAASYGAQAPAASPLTAQIGALPFFRIEGHLGQSASAVVTALEAQIRSQRLPITVQAVHLGVDKSKIVWKWPAPYTDIHRMQHLVRHAVTEQLTELSDFTGNLRSEVESAVQDNVITNPPNVDVVTQMKSMAYEKHRTVTANANTAKQKLAAGQASWVDDATNTVMAAADFKLQVGSFAKTQFLAPLDTMIAVQHAPWLEWLGDLIKDKEDHADDHLLFTAFVDRHPGIEHFAGVLRGGTFIVAYDESGTVVADFMLPYYLQPPEPPVQPPPLSPPTFKPPWHTRPSIHVLAAPERVFGDQLEKYVGVVELFKGGPLPDWVKGGTGGIVQPPLGGSGPLVQPAGGTRPPMGDPELEHHYLQIEAASRTLEQLQAKTPEPGTDPVALQQQIQAAEGVVAQAVVEAGTYVASSGTPVEIGTDGHTTMVKVAQTVSRLTTTDALNKTRTGLNSAATGAPNLDAKNALTNIVQLNMH